MSGETATGAPTHNPTPDKGIPEEGVHPRRQWDNKFEYFLSMVGNLIFVGNVCRFPYLCYIHGGGVFLFPYVMCVLFLGFPVLFLELALGQYTREGIVTAWRKICPLFQGVGIAVKVLLIYENIYLMPMFAWILLYLFNSFGNPLPWSTCDNPWNTEECTSHYNMFSDPDLFRPNSSWSFLNNLTIDYSDISLMNETFTFPDDKMPEEEFFFNRILNMSDDIFNTSVSWEQAMCLLLAWIICYFCIWSGVKSIGKVAYVTVTVPCLLLFILFIRGVTLPGAAMGLRYYLEPDFTRIADTRTWSDAASEVFYSYVLCNGVLTTMGSYNRYNNNCYRDCMVLCCLSFAFSFFAGFVVFSFLGYTSSALNLSLERLAASGPGLLFISFPKAVSLMPASSFFAVVFFFMIILLTLDNQVLFLESLVTAIVDLFPRRLRKAGARRVLALVVCLVCFLLGLPYTTGWGIILFNVVDGYGCSFLSILIIAIAEVTVVAWVYGADRFYDNIKDMIGYKPFPLLKYCWLFITPLILGILLSSRASDSHVFMVNNYIAGTKTIILGGVIMVFPLLCIPVFIFITLCRDAENCMTPSADLRQAQPHNPTLSLCGNVISRAQGPANGKADDGNGHIALEEPARV